MIRRIYHAIYGIFCGDRNSSVSGFKNQYPRAGSRALTGCARGNDLIRERPGLYKNAGIGENFGPEVGQAMKLAPPIGQIFQEYRDIVIGRLVRDRRAHGSRTARRVRSDRRRAHQGRHGTGAVSCRRRWWSRAQPAGLAGSNPLAGSHWNQPDGKGEKPSIPRCIDNICLRQFWDSETCGRQTRSRLALHLRSRAILPRPACGERVGVRARATPPASRRA